ncbi:hypothetical protein KSP39_PZI015155 [Platanthera zijinensis]|uniref:Uncharacterized protein n=1 Tax=Platanthera zijinensis TaxID=2320716 RepID=A0AAP0G2R1_9ASPA
MKCCRLLLHHPYSLLALLLSLLRPYLHCTCLMGKEDILNNEDPGEEDGDTVEESESHVRVSQAAAKITLRSSGPIKKPPPGGGGQTN